MLTPAETIFDPQLITALHFVAKETGKTETDIIREAVKQFIEQFEQTKNPPAPSLIYANFDAQLARRKANRWLIEQVGNMALADQARLIQANGKIMWQFGVYITASTHPPIGPIGYVNLDAITLAVLTSSDEAKKLSEEGEHVKPPLLSAKS